MVSPEILAPVFTAIGTIAVPRLIRWRGGRFALVLGACGFIVCTAMLVVTRTTEVAAVVKITLVPQQHRLFALVPAVAPVALGLNGSGIYVGSTLGAALVGGVQALAGAAHSRLLL